jgi:succinate dehydrogenase/fumarate reductase flavoprotein subunit
MDYKPGGERSFPTRDDIKHEMERIKEIQKDCEDMRMRAVQLRAEEKARRMRVHRWLAKVTTTPEYLRKRNAFIESFGDDFDESKFRQGYLQQLLGK